MTPDTAHGKAFEKDCTAAFGKLYTKYRCRWERTIDSAAAGNIIKSADSDFRLMVHSGIVARPYLIYFECKASKQDVPFQKLFRSAVKGHQNASIGMARRGGAEACVMFRDLVRDEITIWRGRDINAAYPIKRQPMLAQPCVSIRNANLDELAIWIVSSIEEFIDALGADSHESRVFL